MRAMALHAQAPIATHPLRLEEREPPPPGPHEVRVRVAACGICRTDLHVVEGDLPLARAPIVPGHQVIGRVEALGAGASRFRPGDRVGIAWLRGTCGACDFCRSGRENLCPGARFTGYHADGGFADAALVHEDFAYAVPEAFADVEAAPLLCAGIIGYRALALAAVPSGGRLALYGFGSSAHVTLQIARARGAEVYVATREASHRALALELGAAWAGGARDPLPRPAHAAILFAPAGELVPVALESLERGGTLALAGIHVSPVPPLDYERHLFYERVLRSVTANTRADGVAFLGEAARAAVRLRTTIFPLERANEALDALTRGAFAGSGVLVSSAAPFPTRQERP
ncbi:MAG TPA: zinc-dependent alcohol dehydrogenase family protein [Methylomirabilota bacterium]|jgi:propanol-preferring alcohol dehydrogenase|nr:zinc-dependent alcohol dehydrogenase family protein [Methylomirabilota bacterium]